MNSFNCLCFYIDFMLPFKYIYIIVIFAAILCGCYGSNQKPGYETEGSYDETDNLSPVSSGVVKPNGDTNNEYGVVEEEETIYADNVDEHNGINLPNRFSNEKFSIKYPLSWEIVQLNSQLQGVNINVQIMQKWINDYDFRPNINIIVSKDKHRESTSYLARNSYMQSKDKLKGLDITTSLIGIRDCMVGGCYGSVAEYTAYLNGYSMHIFQYVVKKKDNTTMIITLTLDQNNLVCQKEVGMAIINSIEIF